MAAMNEPPTDRPPDSGQWTVDRCPGNKTACNGLREIGHRPTIRHKFDTIKKARIPVPRTGLQSPQRCQAHCNIDTCSSLCYDASMKVCSALTRFSRWTDERSSNGQRHLSGGRCFLFSVKFISNGQILYQLHKLSRESRRSLITRCFVCTSRTLPTSMNRPITRYVIISCMFEFKRLLLARGSFVLELCVGLFISMSTFLRWKSQRSVRIGSLAFH